MKAKRLKLLIVALLATLLLTVGCSKLTKENYDKLKMGMEYSEVVALLGEPDSGTESMGFKSCIWGDESKNITVQFVADKIMVFSCTDIK